MIALSELKHKQIIFFTSYDGSYKLRYLNENLVLEVDGKITNRLSIHKILALFIIGDTSMTTQIIQQSLSHGVSIIFLKRNFDVYAQLNPTASANYLLRSQQYHQDNNLERAKWVVTQKLTAQLNNFKRIKTKTEIQSIQNSYEQTINQALDADTLRGVEGTISRMYFQDYFAELDWSRRVPRAKYDIPNLLLDIGYTYLFHTIDAMLQLYGFDTYKGFYHTTFFQRRSLACDIMEPFRPIIDKTLRKAYNLGQINPKDFKLKGINYTLEWKNATPYNKLFAQTIMDHREDLHHFVKGYYLHTMKPTKYQLPIIQSLI